MAEFCNYCASRLDFPKPDFDVHEIFNNLPNDHYRMVLCEGCTMAAVAKVDNKIMFYFLSDDRNYTESEVEDKIESVYKAHGY